MVIHDFSKNYRKYENMSIWEIKSLDDFFKAHENLLEIFEKEYGFVYSERHRQSESFKDSDITVITKLLDYFGDKWFFIFSNNDQHHQD